MIHWTYHNRQKVARINAAAIICYIVIGISALVYWAVLL